MQTYATGSEITIGAQKHQLRAELMARRDQIIDREAQSEAIRTQIIALPAFQRARAIHCYFSIRSEVDTHLLIATAFTHGKAVAIPVVESGRRLSHSWINGIDPADFIAGKLGVFSPRIISPAEPGDWDLTIVPLLGFDRAGHRLGYGGGYYDALLAVTPAIAIGLAFAAQEVSSVPHESHDIRLDAVVTTNEVLLIAHGLPA